MATSQISEDRRGPSRPFPPLYPHPYSCLASLRNSGGARDWGSGSREEEGYRGARADAPSPRGLFIHLDPRVRTLPAWQARLFKFPHSLPLPITDCSRTLTSHRISPPVGFQSPAHGVGRERVRRLAGMSPGGLSWKLSFPFGSPLRPCVKILILLVKKHCA